MKYKRFNVGKALTAFEHMVSAGFSSSDLSLVLSLLERSGYDPFLLRDLWLRLMGD